MKSDVQFLTDEQRLRPGKSEVFRLWGDNSLLKELSGFTPDYDFISFIPIILSLEVSTIL